MAQTQNKQPLTSLPSAHRRSRTDALARRARDLKRSAFSEHPGIKSQCLCHAEEEAIYNEASCRKPNCSSRNAHHSAASLWRFQSTRAAPAHQQPQQPPAIKCRKLHDLQGTGRYQVLNTALSFIRSRRCLHHSRKKGLGASASRYEARHGALVASTSGHKRWWSRPDIINWGDVAHLSFKAILRCCAAARRKR